MRPPGIQAFMYLLGQFFNQWKSATAQPCGSLSLDGLAQVLGVASLKMTNIFQTIHLKLLTHNDMAAVFSKDTVFIKQFTSNQTLLPQTRLHTPCWWLHWPGPAEAALPAGTALLLLPKSSENEFSKKTPKEYEGSLAVPKGGEEAKKKQ